VAQPAELAQGRRNPRSPGLPFNGRRLGRAARIGVSGSRRDQLNLAEQAGSEGGGRFRQPQRPGVQRLLRPRPFAQRRREPAHRLERSGLERRRARSRLYRRQAQLEPRSDPQVDRRIHLKGKSGGA
jgi:hypothetical protein